MKLASFFFLSLVLHASALVYPVSFHAPTQANLIDVTILPIERESHGAGAQGAIGNRAALAASKSASSMPRTVQPAVELKPTSDPESQTLPAEAPANLSASSAAITAPAGNAANGSGGTGSGNGFGWSGTGSGRGSSNGNGTSSSGNGVALTQARYRDTPRPDYPESARREGREGRVLLRVLVDDQGQSKKVEINISSGSDALDRAAAEAIRRWRFLPARDGDKPVESWLRIPIEFHLADAKPW